MTERQGTAHPGERVSRLVTTMQPIAPTHLSWLNFTTGKVKFLLQNKLLGFLASLVVQTVKNLPATGETRVRSLGQEDPPGGEHGNPLQYSCLEDSMDRGAWRATVHGVAKNQTQLSY